MKNGDPTKPDFYAILWTVSQIFGKEVQNFYKKGHYDTDSYRLACYSACTFLAMTPFRIALLLNINTPMADRYIDSIANTMASRTTFTRVRLIKEQLERLKGRPPELHVEKSYGGKGFHRNKGRQVIKSSGLQVG